jgi:Uma2 family endonuclease
MPGTLTKPGRPDRKVAAPAASPPTIPVDALGDERFLIPGLTWESYVAINNAVVERPGVRMIYCDGTLTLLTESRKHGRSSRRLYLLAVAPAEELAIPWEEAGSTTYRRRRKKGGVEGDETFYFGPHAEIMKGSKDVDLETQPPPDLAIEVEVSHSADDAVIVWGRLGVPEVWRFDPIAWECSFWKRRRNGTYARVDRSVAFPMLMPDDVIEQMRLADELGSAEWHTGLRRWARKVIARSKRKGG